MLSLKPGTRVSLPYLAGARGSVMEILSLSRGIRGEGGATAQPWQGEPGRALRELHVQRTHLSHPITPSTSHVPSSVKFSPAFIHAC